MSSKFILINILTILLITKRTLIALVKKKGEKSKQENCLNKLIQQEPIMLLMVDHAFELLFIYIFLITKKKPPNLCFIFHFFFFF